MRFLLLTIILVLKTNLALASFGLKFLAFTSLPTDTNFEGSPVGGLSGMMKLSESEYLAISDDRSELAAARMIKFSISFADNKLKVEPSGIIPLSVFGQPFKYDEIDSEAITAIASDVIITSEGSYRKDKRIPPFIRRFTRDGKQLSDIVFNHHRYVPQASGTISRGVRPNKGFESASTTPSQKTLFVASESNLYQDATDVVRLMAIDLENKTPIREYALKLDQYPKAKNGLSDIMAISEDTLIALERAWDSKKKRQIIRIYKVSINGAANVENLDDIQAPQLHLNKTLVLDFDDLKMPLDNMEILCLGPTVDGKPTLIVASDNNFSKEQSNQFYLFSILDK